MSAPRTIRPASLPATTSGPTAQRTSPASTPSRGRRISRTAAAASPTASGSRSQRRRRPGCPASSPRRSCHRRAARP
jgi:hypothetical protein